MSESVLPMFSSKSFIVYGLTFRSLIHLKTQDFIIKHDGYLEDNGEWQYREKLVSVIKRPKVVTQSGWNNLCLVIQQ